MKRNIEKMKKVEEFTSANGNIEVFCPILMCFAELNFAKRDPI